MSNDAGCVGGGGKGMKRFRNDVEIWWTLVITAVMRAEETAFRGRGKLFFFFLILFHYQGGLKKSRRRVPTGYLMWFLSACLITAAWSVPLPFQPSCSHEGRGRDRSSERISQGINNEKKGHSSHLHLRVFFFFLFNPPVCVIFPADAEINYFQLQMSRTNVEWIILSVCLKPNLKAWLMVQ